MGDGKSFEVEAVDPDSLALRSQYERLIEIHQEKGNSECLSAFFDAGEDCNFEIRLTQNSRLTKRAAFSAADWEQMRRGYVRGLLLKGLPCVAKRPADAMSFQAPPAASRSGPGHHLSGICQAVVHYENCRAWGELKRH